VGETPVKIERKKITSEGKRKGELTGDKEWVSELFKNNELFILYPHIEIY
jgi:hypothetical protein